LFQQKRYKEAENILRQLLAEQPQNPHALYALAKIELRFNAFKDAIPLLVKCTALMPGHPEPLLQLAGLFKETNQPQDADRCFQQLVKRFPELGKAHFNYAGFLQSVGDKNNSLRELRKTLQLEPKHTAAMLALTDLYRIENNDPIIKQMQNLLKEIKGNINRESSKKNQVAEMHLHYALGKCFDDLDDYQTAFTYWKAANQIQLNQCDFRVTQMLPFYSQLKAVFTAINPNVKIARQRVQLRPIFIVGMPRSGSTLLEQMLRSHSEIESAGEVNYIGGNVVSHIQQITGKPYPLALDQLNKEQLIALGDDYLKALQKHHPKAGYIVDKLPANFQSVGLIKMILPDAIIINLSRNPLATGVSIYRNYFAENEPYFCDLNEFSEYYLAYCDLIRYWQKKMPNEMVSITYEELVAQPQKQIERILTRCQLGWQEACLKFYHNPNQVLTLSASQVQQPLYQTSLNKWKNYEPFLSAMKNKLTAI